MVPIIIMVAYSVKFKLGYALRLLFGLEYGQIYEHAQVEAYLEFSIVIITISVITFYFTGLYKRFSGLMPEVNELIKIGKAFTIITFELVLFNFIFKLIPESRFFFFYFWLFGIALLFSARWLIFKIELLFIKKGVGVKNVIVLGSDSFGQDIIEQTILYPTLAERYIGTVCDDKQDKELTYHVQNKLKIIGEYKDTVNILNDYQVDVVYVTSSALKKVDFTLLKSFCLEKNIELFILSEDYFKYSQNFMVKSIDGVSYISFSKPHFNMFQLILKRVFDIVVAIFAISFLLPLFLLVGILIKLSSKGPVFFFQERVTKDDKPFMMMKFRTMVDNAEKQSGPIMVNEGKETRYHRFGEFLRKTSIDELPQLFNILKGEMSLVGPRPERPFFIKKFKQEIPNFEKRHHVKAGLTGWAQVNGRSHLTRRPEKKLKYDLYYINHWSFLFDIKIILRTIQIVLKREEAF